jgi:hypothetical protein
MRRKQRTREAAYTYSISLAPSSNAKLVSKFMDVSKLTNNEKCSFLITFYAATEKLDKKKKYELVVQLRQEMESNQGIMFNFTLETTQYLNGHLKQSI